jgi:hypothetical protein
MAALLLPFDQARQRCFTDLPRSADQNCRRILHRFINSLNQKSMTTSCIHIQIDM